MYVVAVSRNLSFLYICTKVNAASYVNWLLDGECHGHSSLLNGVAEVDCRAKFSVLNVMVVVCKILSFRKDHICTSNMFIGTLISSSLPHNHQTTIDNTQPILVDHHSFTF